MKIGVLALQGDFREHRQMLHELGVDTAEVRKPAQLSGLDGLIIPGGESTTLSKLARSIGLMEPLQQFGRDHTIWGTCAGAILLSHSDPGDQPRLDLMDITVERNAFGRQVDSFEVDLPLPMLRDPQRPFHAVFIRAPLIERVGTGVEVLATLPDRTRIVAARQGHLLATSFHPEITHDTRFHEYFLTLVNGAKLSYNGTGAG